MYETHRQTNRKRDRGRGGKEGIEEAIVTNTGKARKEDKVKKEQNRRESVYIVKDENEGIEKVIR